MIREFQVSYREQRSLTLAEAVASGREASGGDVKAPCGPMLSMRSNAEFEEDVRALLEAQGFFVCQIDDHGPYISPGQQWFTLEQAAKYINRSVTTIYTLCKEGKLTPPPIGDPQFSRKALDEVAAKGAGTSETKKKRIKKLEAKAA